MMTDSFETMVSIEKRGIRTPSYFARRNERRAENWPLTYPFKGI
jgi:hypothetical protein